MTPMLLRILNTRYESMANPTHTQRIKGSAWRREYRKSHTKEGGGRLLEFGGGTKQILAKNALLYLKGAEW